MRLSRYLTGADTWHNSHKPVVDEKRKFSVTEHCKELLGNFLSEFIDVKQGYSYDDEEVIQQSVAALINYKIYTPEELRKDILRKCSVILPLEDIKAWAQKG